VTITSISSDINASRSKCNDLMASHRSHGAGHIVQFYDSDVVVIENVSNLAECSLRAGDATILIATMAHLDSIERRLGSAGLDLGSLRASGLLIALDAADTLSKLLTENWPDQAKFDDVVGGIVGPAIERSANGFAFAFGEMVALLCEANQSAAAVRLEQLWNGLAKTRHFSLCCAYPLASFGSTPDLDAVLQICAEHSLAIPAESLF
jgi:hypothetical protein